jgi:prophage antirepressor-like protein
LTAKGLYKLIFRSGKPFALDFQNWVCDVIEEIRLKGSYDLKKELKKKAFEMEEHTAQLALVEQNKTAIEAEARKPLP